MRPVLLLLALSVLVAPAQESSALVRWTSVLRQAAELDRAKQADAAEKSYQEAIQIAATMDEPERVAQSHNNLGVFYFRNQRYADAEKAFGQAVEIFVKAKAQDTEDALSARSNRVSALLALGRSRDALDEGHRLREAANYWPSAPEWPKLQFLLAQAAQGSGRISSALGHYRSAVSTLVENPPEDSGDEQLRPILAAAHRLVVRLVENEKPSSPLWNDTAILEPTAWLEGRHGDPVLGGALARRAIDALELRFGPGSPVTIRHRCTLTAALRREGKIAEAQEILDGALGLLRSNGDWDETMQLDVLKELAELQAAAGNPELAGETIAAFVAIHRRAFGAAPAHLREVLRRAADDARRLGAPEHAARFVAERDQLPPAPWEAAGASRFEAERPRIKSKMPPEYPSAASSRKLEATVQLLVLVSETGKTTAVYATAGAGFGFEQAAKKAVATWRYTPETFRGQPYATVSMVDVNYLLPKRR